MCGSRPGAFVVLFRTSRNQSYLHFRVGVYTAEPESNILKHDYWPVSNASGSFLS